MQKEAETAVADGEAKLAPEWVWNQGGDDVLHPFWFVRRFTAQQLAKLNAGAGPDDLKLQFNCKLITQQIFDVVTCTLDKQCITRTRIVEVPFLTNCLEIRKGEELILEIDEPQKKTAVKTRTWQDEAKDADRKLAKEEQNNAKKRKTLAL